MKKVLMAGSLILAAAAMTTDAQAQYRPEGGEKNLELMVAPLGGSPVTMAGIKYRSFSSANSAMRLGVFLGFDNKTTVTQDEDSKTKMLELKKKESSFTFAVQPGIEKHMAGTERLSPYFGGYVDLSFTSKSKKDETQLNLSGDKQELGYTKTSSGSLGIGLNAVAGFDYYIAKSLYLGTELGFGLATTMPMKSKSETVDYNDDHTGTTTTNTDGKKDNVSKFQVGPNVVGQFRLGWMF
ncbi:MAG TPA: hypothetical protein PKD45_09025 [Flavobacteriales bacterium]|nr:hypothetical protein [Flavobacteriales bacterium]